MAAKALKLHLAAQSSSRNHLNASLQLQNITNHLNKAQNSHQDTSAPPEKTSSGEFSGLPSWSAITSSHKNTEVITSILITQEQRSSHLLSHHTRTERSSHKNRGHHVH
ncbi:hypothetical protein GDO81_012592 [Engystomops pustulosus]|uniref:Uncharacterized protein n=1 Tax=Engystomops pustulosus TaxID=76066 RepID=A0AAV7B2R0_ENGPU|nr:hypothetical protein GDO81_012592 [Engystomops pustulosus]